MRDYLEKPRRRVVGIRDLKTHAARILRHVRDGRASYVVTHRGQAVGVILPIEQTRDDPDHADAADGPAAWAAFVRAGRRLERRFRPGASGIKLLSASRR